MNSGFVLFLMVVLSNILISGSFAPLMYIGVALLHELGHLALMRYYSGKFPTICFAGIGIAIHKNFSFSYREEILIAFAGPSANLVGGALTLLAYIFFKNEIFFNLFMTNLIYAFLNLLPLPPLDGYHIAESFFSKKFAYHKSKRKLRQLILAAIVFLLLAVMMLLCCKVYNFSLILIVIFLTFNTVIVAFSDF